MLKIVNPKSKRRWFEKDQTTPESKKAWDEIVLQIYKRIITDCEIYNEIGQKFYSYKDGVAHFRY